MSEQHEGSCLCGSIRYRVTRFEAEIANCHCTMCRKFTGAAYATYAAVKSADFEWLSGKDLLIHYHADNDTTRSFCRQCGSGMVFAPAGSSTETSDIIEIALATIDGEVSVKPNAHIYTKYKASWTELDDKLANHPEGRNDHSTNSNCG